MDKNSDGFPPADATTNGDAAMPGRQRGLVWLAWLVILAMMGAMIFPQMLHLKDDAVEPTIILFEIQARYLVGAASVAEQPAQLLQEEIKSIFDKGPLRQRMIGSILMGELVGVDQATKLLSDLQSRIQEGTLIASDDDKNLLEVLQRVQAAAAAGDPSTDLRSDEQWKDDRQKLTAKLGWAGQLALVPKGSRDGEERQRLLDGARKTFFVMIGVFGVALTAALIGVVVQIVWWIFALIGRLHCGTGALRGDASIYAETFALWMAIFVGLNFAVMSLPLPKWGLIWVLIPQIGSLGALAWPVYRGLQWSDVCKDIGLTPGPGAWSIPFVGLGASLSALPVVGAAMVVTLIMMAIASQWAGDSGEGIGSPIHPIVEPILRGNWTIRWQLLLVAVFAAVPEEIMFRGVLYRHLREVGAKWGYFVAVALATLVSSFVFAAIHPQGLFGIPILMGLAIVFALVREWRGSVFPSMIAHALVNAGTSTVLFLIAD